MHVLDQVQEFPSNAAVSIVVYMPVMLISMYIFPPEDAHTTENVADNMNKIVNNY
jgi:hypothetical protein